MQLDASQPSLVLSRPGVLERAAKLTLRYSDIYINYSEVLRAVGKTEFQIAQFFGDLPPAIFT